MNRPAWLYRYVGPADIRAAVRDADAGRVIRTHDDLAAWLAERGAEEAVEPFTFVVDSGGDLRLAPRRSEHVACAGGCAVLSAGEMTFGRTPSGWSASAVSNQSTGYCPDPASWPAVSRALDHAGLPHPGGFTDPFVFRRCETCGEHNVVKDNDHTCVFCGSELPTTWNITPDADPAGI